MAYKSLFVAGLIIYSAGAHSAAGELSCRNHFVGAPSHSPWGWSENLIKSGFQQMGNSNIFFFPSANSGFFVRLDESRDGRTEPQFFADYLLPNLFYRIPTDILDQLEAIVPNGASPATSIAASKSHMLFAVSNPRKGTRLIVASADGTAFSENPKLEVKRAVRRMIEKQKNLSPTERLLESGFRQVAGSPDLFVLEIPPPQGQPRQRSLPILAHVRDGQLLRLLRPLKFTSERDPREIVSLDSFQVLSRRQFSGSVDVAQVRLTGRLFKRELVFTSTGSEQVHLKLNPDFDILGAQPERIIDFLGYDELLRPRSDSDFRLSAVNTTAFLKTLTGSNLICGIRIDEAERIARSCQLLGPNESLAQNLAAANEIIVDQHLSSHRVVAIPVMLAAAIVQNAWGNVFKYNGRLFEVTSIEAAHASLAPFDPYLGNFTKIVVVTDLDSKETIEIPEVLALTIPRQGFYGSLDPRALLRFFKVPSGR